MLTIEYYYESFYKNNIDFDITFIVRWDNDKCRYFNGFFQRIEKHCVCR